MARPASSVEGLGDVIAEIDEIFQNAGTMPAVDAPRAVGSGAMGDVRQESGTSGSFSFVNGGTVDGSSNSNMSPSENNSSNTGSAAAQPGILPNAAAAMNVPGQPVGAPMNAQAQTFAPNMGVLPMMGNPSDWTPLHQIMFQQQQLQLLMAMGGKGKGRSPPAPQAYMAGPMSMPSAIPPQYAAPVSYTHLTLPTNREV